MKYYAMYMFEKSPVADTRYILVKHEGDATNVKFTKYSESEENVNKGIAGKEYICFEVPRNESIKRFFAHTFNFGKGAILSSTEKLDDMNRTFGDTKKIGTNALLLCQFSKDMKRMVMWFVKNSGYSKEMKQSFFKRWTDGERLEYAC